MIHVPRGEVPCTREVVQLVDEVSVGGGRAGRDLCDGRDGGDTQQDQRPCRWCRAGLRHRRWSVTVAGAVVASDPSCTSSLVPQSDVPRAVLLVFGVALLLGSLRYSSPLGSS